MAGGHYDVALKLRISLAEEVERDETKRTGAPGIRDCRRAWLSVAWAALFARDFAKALAVSERAHQLAPDDLLIETNRAHALMFLGRTGEARALYLDHRGKPTSLDGGKDLERRHHRRLCRDAQGWHHASDDGRDREAAGRPPLVWARLH